jgi:GNAT superfamily N-acetyltransferase
MIREAKFSDIGQMQRLRQLLQENIPGVTFSTSYETYEDLLSGLGKAWVYEDHKTIVAFGIIDVVHNAIEGLCVHPKYQQKGIGKRLLKTMLTWYFGLTKTNIWLRTLQNTAATVFCDKLGWCQKVEEKEQVVSYQFNYEHYNSLPTN